MATTEPAVLKSSLAEFVRYRQEHLDGDEKGEAQVFLDRLFRAFGHPGVAEVGAKLEKRIKKTDAKGTAFADLVWKPRCLIEMKKSGVDLARHYRQAFDYWVDLVPDRPQYVILCNFDELWIYDFNRQMDAPVDRIRIDDLPSRSDALAFMLPVPQTPIFGNDLVAVTRDAAAKVARVFLELHARGIARQSAQRFVLQSVVAMFSEDIGLLPAKYFTRALSDSNTGSDAFDLVFNLFREMNSPGETRGGRYKGTPYFNGGIFAAVESFELTVEELDLLREAAATDWSGVRPEIFGTLFEGSMADDERHAHGAHFTSQADIARVIVPTIVRPWQKQIQSAGTLGELRQVLGDMYSYRVLDPACGSGNFLYVAYREMRRLEHEATTLLAERSKSKRSEGQGALAYVTPDHFYGIDRNPFAVEVAKVTMLMAKKLAADELGEGQQVLPLDNLDQSIVAGDALFVPWPQANAVVGNPPYLGRRKMVDELGLEYTQRLAKKYPRVGGVSDFVCYWFPLSHDHLPSGGRAGLVATQSIRETSSRRASLDYVVENGGVIHEAISSKPWSGDAVVHTSIVNWTKDEDVSPKTLWLNNGDLRLELDHIPASLSADVDVAEARPLPVNIKPKTSWQGQTPGVTDGYTLTPEEASDLIRRDRGSATVVHALAGGDELLHEFGPTRWIIDFPHDDRIEAQSDAPAALMHLEKNVLPQRNLLVAREIERNESSANAKPVVSHQRFMSTWWKLWRRRSDMVSEIEKLDRYIGLTITASWERPSVYTFIDASIRPAASIQAFAFDDDYSFGVLTSTIHRKWFEARCSKLKVDLRYTPTTVYNSFPWPQAPSASDVTTIAGIVSHILATREQYLSKGMTLAQQYNTFRQEGSSKLRELHDALDRAVSQAYGFNEDEDPLAQLLALNHDIYADPAVARGPGSNGLSGARVSNYRLVAERS